MEILKAIENREYPTDYLLSRIRGRRILYRDSIVNESPEGIWMHLLKEYQWVYLQMNRQLRRIFWSFFLYIELGTISFCLRYKAGENRKIEELLNFSLLSEDLKELLKKDSSVITVIEGIENAFLSILIGLKGLKEIFIKDGLKGIEQRLMTIYLENIITSKIHPVIKDFFAYIIDSRNIVTLYKHLQWGILNYLPFIRGGSVKEERLRRIFGQQDISGLASLIHSLTGMMIESPNPTNIENSLLKGITVFLKRNGRDPLSIGVILDYLWRCHIETVNQNIILYVKELGRDITTEDLII